ncbi:MAG: sulfatase-like hydrolase/transferase, partial [Deltaproteobacteria bacterium]|nr:sulfatase-like hydrolase/transferase [Deltaproteobacteria bacterium]
SDGSDEGDSDGSDEGDSDGSDEGDSDGSDEGDSEKSGNEGLRTENSLEQSTRTTTSSRALPTLLLYLAAVFFFVKGAAAYVLMEAGGGLAPFIALIPGLWLDLLLLTSFFWLLWPLRDRSLSWAFLPVAMGAGLFSAASWTSFLVTQTWMTWQRLRGDENMTLKDVGQLGEYLAPGIAVVTTSILLIAPAYFLIRRTRLGKDLRQKRVGFALPATAVLLFAIDIFTGPLGLYGLSEQPLVELVSSAFAKVEKETEPLSSAEFQKVHRTLVPMDEGDVPPALQSPKNVVLYLAEGIPWSATSFSDVVDTTPNIKRRFEKYGVLFDNYYTHTHRSIHAIFSTICSLYPPATVDAMTALHPRIDCGSLMEKINEVPDIHQGLFHGGRFSFANKLAILARRGFDVTLDAEDLGTQKKPNGKKWGETWWGIDDRAVVDAALAFVDSVPKDEPFFLMIIPIAPHEPYNIPKDAKVPKTIKGGTKKRNKFLRSVQFSDQVFERLMKGLEERGRYDDTLIAYAPDHGNYIDEPSRPTRGKRMLYQGNVHVPLVFLHKNSFAGERTHRLASQIDLSPTLTRAIGGPLHPQDWGQDLFSSSYKRKRVYLLKTRGASPFVGLVDGDWKFMHELNAGRSELYNLKDDPDEMENLVEDFPARVRKYATDAIRFRHAQRKTLLVFPSLVEKGADAKELFSAAKLVCQGKPCPKGMSIKVAECKGKWAKAPCLQLKIPKEETLIVELPASVVGTYDSIRVKWWNRERQKVDKASIALRYGALQINPRPKQHRGVQHRVLPIPHTRLGAEEKVYLEITALEKMGPVLEFFEH